MVLSESVLRWSRKGVTALSDQGLFAASGFIVNLLLARWFSAEQYGAYALAFSVYLFVGGFQNAMLLEPMSVFGPASYRDSLPDYLGWLLRLHFAVTVGLGLCLAFVGAGVLAFSKNMTIPAALWGVAVGLPWMLLLWLWRRAAYLGYKPNLAVRGAVVNLIITLALMFVFHFYQWLSPFTAFVVQGIAGLAGSVTLMISLRPKLRLHWEASVSREVFRRHWEYGRWVVLTAFVIWLGNDSYYLILAWTHGVATVAPFRALQNLVKPIYQAVTAVTLLAVPWAATHFADRNIRQFRLVVDRICVIFAGGAVAYLAMLTVFGPKLMHMFYAGKYTDSSYLLPLVGLPILFVSVAEGPSIALRAMEAPSEVFWSYAAASLFTVIGGFVLTWRWSIGGAATGIAASSFVFCIMMFVRYRARLGQFVSSEDHVARIPSGRFEVGEEP